ncbi:MAG: hypothetical protein P8171_23075 [Candidatus Thiodiazotropha sp.]
MKYQTILLAVLLGAAPVVVQADDSNPPPCGPGMMYGPGYGMPYGSPPESGSNAPAQQGAAAA